MTPKCTCTCCKYWQKDYDILKSKHITIRNFLEDLIQRSRKGFVSVGILAECQEALNQTCEKRL